MEVKLDHHRRFESDHPASVILHSCQDMRVILVNLMPGQSLPIQTNSSSVYFHVIEGMGDLLCGCDWVPAARGTMRFYPPGESHAVRATAEPTTVLITMAPRP